MEINGHIENLKFIEEALAESKQEKLALQFAINLMQEVADGRRPLLPCAIGDDVYVPCYGISKYNITGYTEGVCIPLTLQGVVVEHGDMGAPEIEEFDAEELGKTVFLTREAAEKALAAGKWIRSELSDCC